MISFHPSDVHEPWISRSLQVIISNKSDRRQLYVCIQFNLFTFILLDPSFLTVQLGYTAIQQTVTAVIYNIGAIMGGTIVGYYSLYFGRKRSIIVCAIVGGAIISLWVFAPNIAGLQFGAWLMQFCVQDAWGKSNANLADGVR